jgi:hypothetical protein
MTRRLSATLLALTLAAPAVALAQRRDSAAATRPAIPPSTPWPIRPIASAASLEAARQALGPQRPLLQGATPSPTPSRPRGVTRKILGGVAGGFAGLFAGGYLGAALEGNRCHCDDPGLQGALIGAPVGAAAGAILGALFF